MDVAGAQARTIPLLLRHPAAPFRGSASVAFSCGGSRRSWAATATADGEDGGGRGYERVAMDTPGAYRLVDRTTGRSVIVWGGVDDGDEPSVPSSEVFSRTARDFSADRSASKGSAQFGNFKCVFITSVDVRAKFSQQYSM
jgi:ATP-dependent RNA helicase DDX18/HAS1